MIKLEETCYDECVVNPITLAVSADPCLVLSLDHECTTYHPFFESKQ
jgi:hypothetical protein